MIPRTSRRLLPGVLALTLTAAGAAAPAAHAGAIGTDSFLAAEAQELDRRQTARRVEAFLLRENVRAELGRYGVDPAEARARVAALTDAELASLDGRIQSLPAGAGTIEVIGVTFLVLVILELLGVTDIFKAI